MSRWDAGPKTYVNYGRACPGRIKLMQTLVKLHIKVVRFYKLRALTPEDRKWAARMIDGLEALMGEDVS